MAKTEETLVYVAQRKFVMGNQLIAKDGEVTLNSRQAEFYLNDGTLVLKAAAKSAKDVAKADEVVK